MAAESTLRWVLDQWTTCLAQSLEAMAEQPPRIEWTAAAGLPPSGLLWWEQRFQDLGTATIWVGAPEAVWEGLGRGILNAAGIEQVESADARSTYLELLNQSLASLAHALTARAEHEVLCAPGSETAAQAGGDGFTVSIRLGETQLPPMLVRVSGMEPLDRAPETAVVEPAPATVPATRPETGLLDVLLDVELPVTVSFGSAQVVLSDVLKFTTGSLIELNRTVNEPVQVIVNNCVIARGDVVVVEGNYGVRIKEIASRQERLRSLR